MYICHVSSIYCLPAHTKAACKCVVHVNAQIHDDTLYVSENVAVCAIIMGTHGVCNLSIM